MEVRAPSMGLNKGHVFFTKTTLFYNDHSRLRGHASFMRSDPKPRPLLRWTLKHALTGIDSQYTSILFFILLLTISMATKQLYLDLK